MTGYSHLLKTLLVMSLIDLRPGLILLMVSSSKASLGSIKNSMSHGLIYLEQKSTTLPPNVFGWFLSIHGSQIVSCSIIIYISSNWEIFLLLMFSVGFRLWMLVKACGAHPSFFFLWQRCFTGICFREFYRLELRTRTNSVCLICKLYFAPDKSYSAAETVKWSSGCLFCRHACQIP